MSLTIVAINHAKPKDKTYRLYDEKGLYLEVTKAGGKLWRLKYRFGETRVPGVSDTTTDWMRFKATVISHNRSDGYVEKAFLG